MFAALRVLQELQAPRAAKSTPMPRASQARPRAPLEEPEAPQECPKSGQERPKSHLEAAKTRQWKNTKDKRTTRKRQNRADSAAFLTQSELLCVGFASCALNNQLGGGEPQERPKSG